MQLKVVVNTTPIKAELEEEGEDEQVLQLNITDTDLPDIDLLMADIMIHKRLGAHDPGSRGPSDRSVGEHVVVVTQHTGIARDTRSTRPVTGTRDLERRGSTPCRGWGR